ncbi:MAG: TolC family protein [Planctomycetota bacterium]|nr:TolC family protein [Planctomycetota bacterium]MEC8511094.1 TolC family protein [Planctomycetota bacterium]
MVSIPALLLTASAMAATVAPAAPLIQSNEPLDASQAGSEANSGASTDPIDERPGARTFPSRADALGADATPMTLEQCLGMALSNNLGLERALIESEIAQFDAMSSWGAFDWVFDMRGAYTDSESEANTALAGADVVEQQDARVDLDLTKPFTWGGSFAFHFDTQQSRTNNAFFNAPELIQDNVRLSYTQPLFRGRGIEAQTAQQREAEIVEQQRREDRRGARQNLLHDVEVAYWELVAALQQLEVARSGLALGEEQVSREEARVRAGDGTEVDVLQARTEVATRTEALLQAENDVEQREDDLKRLMFADSDPDRWDRDIQPRSILPDAAERPDLPDWQRAYEVALSRRVEVRNARLSVDVSRVQLTRARNDRLHGLDLELIASSNGVDEKYPGALSDALEFRFPTYTVALNYNVPVQNRRATFAERAARERLRGSQVALEEAEITALADVRRALRDVNYRAEAVAAAAQSLRLARGQLDAEEKRFAADLTTTFEVLQFQQTLIEAASTRSRAGVEYAKALVGLKRAQGVVGEPVSN